MTIEIVHIQLGQYADIPTNLLTKDELLRLKSFPTEQRRKSFAIGRTELRKKLGEKLNLSPEKVSLTQTSEGKPCLKDLSYHFSISHTDEDCVLAFSKNEPIGIDIEKTNQSIRHLKILKRFFKSQKIYGIVESLPNSESLKYFLNLWCAHEALIKLEGRKLLDFEYSLHLLEQLPREFCQIDIEEYRIEKIQNLPEHLIGILAFRYLCR